MKQRFLATCLIVCLAQAFSLLAAEPGGTRTWYGYFTVKDDNGVGISGVSVELIVTTWYGDELNPQYYTCYKTGVTGSGGYVTLSCSILIEYASGLESMWAYMTDSRYSVLSSQDTYTYTNQAIWPVFNVVYDQDGDLMNDNLEAQLAQKFSPVLHKHSYDLQPGLQNFESLMTGGSFTLIVYNDNGQVITTQSISGNATALHKWNTWQWDTYGHGSMSTGNYNLDLQDNKRYTEAATGQRPLYYHVYKDGNYYYVQFWYYFAMDDKREQLNGINATWHESDWEHVSLRVYKNANGDYVPDLVNFYMHEGGFTVPASSCWWSPSNALTYSNIQQGYSTSRTHLHIWISANGHASYNRYQNVYKITFAGVTYQDRVDYEPTGYNLYFVYDQLTNLGEVIKQTSVECPNSGYTLAYHVYPLKSMSKHWLAYVGRLGDFDDPIGAQSPSPTMPSNESLAHEWWAFTINTSGFGNNPSLASVTWVVDNSIGD